MHQCAEVVRVRRVVDACTLDLEDEAAIAACGTQARESELGHLRQRGDIRGDVR